MTHDGAAGAGGGGGTLLLRNHDDRSLVLAAVLGSIPAFDELVHRYRAAAVLTAWRVLGSVDRSAAEDVAQDAFVLAFKALPQLDDPEQFPAWLRAICRNRALRVAASGASKTLAAEPSVLDRLLTTARPDEAWGGDPARALERRLRAEALWDALSALPDEQGEPLFLHHHEGWPLEKIAAYLSLPVSTVRGRLFRGRETLRRRLRCIEEEEDEDGKDAEYR